MAKELELFGYECHFIMRDHEEWVTDIFASHNYALHLLPKINGKSLKEKDTSSWLSVPVDVDVHQTKDLISKLRTNILVIDHYAIAKNWEKHFRDLEMKIIVIDDLGNRPHACDMLIDQSAGCTVAKYRELVGRNTKLFCGADYSILRSEFSYLNNHKWKYSSDRNENLKVGVMLGGSDPHNFTLDVLKIMRLNKKFAEVNVILGAAAQHKSCIQDFCQKNDEFTLHVNSTEIALIYRTLDFVVGAGGVSAYERLSLGVPAILISVADNQRAGIDTLVELGGAVFGGNALLPNWQEVFQEGLSEIIKPVTRFNAVSNGKKITKGFGAKLLLANILQGDATLYFASLHHAKQIFDWRFSQNDELFYKSNNRPTFSDHLNFLNKLLARQNEILLMLEFEGEMQSHIRLSLKSPQSATIGVCVSPQSRGKGLGARSLNAIHVFAYALGLKSIFAEIHAQNRASIRMFEKSGYLLKGTEGLFRLYELEVAGQIS